MGRGESIEKNIYGRKWGKRKKEKHRRRGKRAIHSRSSKRVEEGRGRGGGDARRSSITQLKAEILHAVLG